MKKTMLKKTLAKKEDRLHDREDSLHKRIEKLEKADEALHKKLSALHKSHKSSSKDPKKSPKHESRSFKNKVSRVMHEFKEDKLHSGSKKGPRVSNPKQAIAIALSEARRVKKLKK